MNQVASDRSRGDEFLGEMERRVSDPLHKRLIQAYHGEDPAQSMEFELATILLEILHRED